ncbi:hypothetical protein [Hyalangium versicolor]|uniref:hypothetical protein n=1 Tax=Hyalangium versicolor TaxID=2861190 RepID=UPI001CCC52C3|nr:hypothetical protein [Hyalangium versicolor]
MKTTTLLLSSTLAVLGLGPHLQPTAPPTPSAVPSPAAPAPDLQQFMEKELNSALTDVSYQVFHARRSGDAPAPELVEALERLSTKASLLAHHPRGQDADGTSFRIYSVQLQVAVRGLTEASLEGDEVQQRFWMTHVSSVCNSCHAEYRE